MKRFLRRILFRAEYDELQKARVRLELLEADALFLKNILTLCGARHGQELVQRWNQAQAEIARLKAPKRARFDRYVALSPDQRAEMLGGSASLPQVKAILELIDEKFQEASDAGCDPKLPDAETKFNLGGADWLVRLKAEIQNLTETAREGAAR